VGVDWERAISLARERVSSQSWVERKVLLLDGLIGMGGVLVLSFLGVWKWDEVLGSFGSSKVWRLSIYNRNMDVSMGLLISGEVMIYCINSPRHAAFRVCLT